VLKVELHSHSADDPVDRLTHTTPQLIDRAASLGYDALAITLHDKQLDLEPVAAYAERRGIVLIPGIERTIQGKHVLLLNFSRAGAEQVQSFADLARLKRRERGLVVAPHPFFPTATCLRELMDVHADLFDAVEYNAMFMRAINFNRAAERWARTYRKPMVGNCDVHRLQQLGTTFSLVDADRNPDSICDAIAGGHVTVVAEPHSPVRAMQLLADIMIGGMLPDWSSPRTPAPDPLAS
jgi:predicted metal-dependent phosphoesterase TrpH